MPALLIMALILSARLQDLGFAAFGRGPTEGICYAGSIGAACTPDVVDRVVDAASFFDALYPAALGILAWTTLSGRRAREPWPPLWGPLAIGTGLLLVSALGEYLVQGRVSSYISPDLWFSLVASPVSQSALYLPGAVGMATVACGFARAGLRAGAGGAREMSSGERSGGVEPAADPGAPAVPRPS